MKVVDGFSGIEDAIIHDLVQPVVAEASLRAKLVGSPLIPAPNHADRKLELVRGFNQPLRVVCRYVVLTFGPAIPDCIALVLVVIPITARQDDRICTTISLTVDTALRGTVDSVTDSAQLRRPPLTDDKRAVTVEFRRRTLHPLVYGIGISLGTVCRRRDNPS